MGVGLSFSKSISRWDDKSETAKVIICNSNNVHDSIVGRDCHPDNKNLAVCLAVVTVGLGCLYISEAANFSVAGAMQWFSPLGGELERGVEYKYNTNSPLSCISKFTTVH